MEHLSYALKREKPQSLPVFAPELTPRMRAILIDWLVEVNFKYGECDAVFHRTVKLIDQYLSVRSGVLKKNFQLLGIAAFWLACKYTVDYFKCSVGAKSLTYICEDQYTRKQLLEMELDILAAIDYQFDYATAIDYIGVNQVCEEDFDVRIITKYLLEVSLMDHELAMTSPSLLNAAAAMLASRTRRETEKSETFDHDPTQVQECADKILQHLRVYVTGTLKAVSKKYSSPSYHRAALFVEKWLKEH
jgi:cyclin B